MSTKRLFQNTEEFGIVKVSFERNTIGGNIAKEQKVYWIATQDFLYFFKGQDVRVPGLVRAHAIVTEYGDAINTVDVKFYIFNPYRYVKKVKG